MAISTARRIAYDVLRRVEAEGAYATDELHTELVASVKTQDAALAMELTLGVLRWRRLLDFLLDRQLKNPVANLDLPVALALRMGLYQLRFLERIPARAAVNESAELVKRARKSSAASLVNAILRRVAIQTRQSAEDLLPSNISQAERLGILYSHPTWMVERWLPHLGELLTIRLLEANNSTPRLSCALHDPQRREEVPRALEKAGLRLVPGQLLKAAFAVEGGSPARTEAFRNGWISIQDEASQAVPLLLDVHADDHVLDLCAAPGGKTPLLARAAGRKGVIVATDRYAHRLRAMHAQFVRLGLPDIHLVELDAAKTLPFRIQFERILVDAPCSGPGTLARHPEIRWRLRPERLAEFHHLQTEILARALAQVARGGRLVYSTCSLEPEENEDVVADALEKACGEGLVVRRLPASETARALEGHLAEGVEASRLFDGAGRFRTSPAVHQCDGFFAVAIEKH